MKQIGGTAIDGTNVVDVMPQESVPIRQILASDPIWAAYAIGDLRPDFAPDCQWTVAGDASGLALLYTGLEPPILLTVGSPDGVAEALAHAHLPTRVFLSALEEHLPAILQRFPEVEKQQMFRMFLPPEVPFPPAGQSATRLGLADVPRLERLYAFGGSFTPDSFAAYQIEDGYFFGIEDKDGALVAAGGTHLVYREERVAAIGNIYVRPDSRGRGHGQAITGAIVGALRADGYHLIVLNVNQRNRAACALYEKLGFVIHCSFIEGEAKVNELLIP